MKRKARKRRAKVKKQSLRPFEELYKKVFAKDRIGGILVR